MVMIISIDKNWKMRMSGGREVLPCRGFPVSMYQTLLACGRIDNPYYGENEWEARELSYSDCEFFTSFVPSAEFFDCDKAVLTFYGTDTIAEILLNGLSVGHTDNMFVTYRFDVRDKLVQGKNTLSVKIKSPLKYIEQKQTQRPVWGVESTVAGYPHIRKSHCMFGWDWGPQLPDMGIWRGVTLEAATLAKTESVYYTQRFNDDYSVLTLTVKPEISLYRVRPLDKIVEIALSDGRILRSRTGVTEGNVTFTVSNPPLWQVRGYGEQLLQSVKITLLNGENVVDEYSEKIGFRRLTVRSDPDSGVFCFNCNGIDIFAMGADYIPQDQIFPYSTEQRTADFLQQCVKANYNSLRIWGGGVYPDDFFLSECDRLGIALWQDFMFACASYRLTPELESTIRQELECNIKRMRNHASIVLWCGNNEIESMWEGWGIPPDREAQDDYIRLFEEIIPETVNQLDPERFYWPSSPSSGGNQFGAGVFCGSGDTFRGDQHYWDVWHNFKPLEEFRKFLFPFCSEYGFESIPCMKTIMSFAKKEELNLCSPVMECHQKCTKGNEKLLYYIAQMCRYPYDFERLIYASQLVQSDAIRSDAEHMRRNRGKCMGSLYWQVNDSNPVISWSSLDYFNRWKALHYAAERFYAPVLVSAVEDENGAVGIHVSNERRTAASGEIRWALRDESAAIITAGTTEYSVGELSSALVISVPLGEHLSDYKNKRRRYLEFSAYENSAAVSKGTLLFVRPKTFEFRQPDISLSVSETESQFVITLTAVAFAKSVCLDLSDADCHFSENWFDIHGDAPVTVTVEKNSLSKPLTAAEFKRSLTVMSCFDLQ